MNHKKIGILLPLIVLSFWILTIPLPAQTTLSPGGGNIPTFIDGLPLTFDVPPVLKDGRALVPFRAIAEGLGIQVEWNEENQTVQGAIDTATLLLNIGNHTAFLNGEAISLDVAPEITNGRTLIPLRVFSEALGFQVNWLSQERVIKIWSPPSHMPVTGFYALGGSGTSSWKNLFRKDFPETEIGNTKIIDKIALGWYSLDETGNLLTKSPTGWQRPEGWETVLQTAKEFNLKAEMVIHMTDKNGGLRKLIDDPVATAKAIGQIATEVTLYDGVNLDLEGLGWQEQDDVLIATRNAFSEFVKQLYQYLQGKNASLTLTLHAPNSAYLGYDYEILGNYCDEMIIMAYDYGPKPEPVQLVTQAIEDALKTVPATKLLLGISSPSETPDSLIQKIGLAKRYDLKGIAIWRLGLISTEMWQVLEKR